MLQVSSLHHSSLSHLTPAFTEAYRPNKRAFVWYYSTIYRDKSFKITKGVNHVTKNNSCRLSLGAKRFCRPIRSLRFTRNILYITHFY